MIDEAAPTGSSDTDLVPAQWPAARTDTPSPVWTLCGLPALPGMILLWLVPKWAGAALATSGWRAAIAAHVLAVVVGVGLIAWAETPRANPFGTTLSLYGPDGADMAGPEMTVSEYLRAPLAAFAFAAYEAPARWGGLILTVVVVGGVELGLVLVAVAMMPFGAAGERAALLFGRCLRLTWWSTTVLIPLGVGWLLAPLVRGPLGLPYEWAPFDLAVVALFIVWWSSVLIRSGCRYGGLPDGPGWAPRTPRCEACGYEISHLPPTTNCPECGRPVPESVAEHRQPPTFATSSGLVRSLGAFWITLKGILLDRSFFDRLAVHRDHARGRTFFLVVCHLNAVLGFLAAAVNLTNLWSEAFVFGCACLLAQVILVGLLAIVVAAIGRRAVQTTAVAVFYAGACLCPVAVAALLLAVTPEHIGPVADGPTMWRWSWRTVVVGVLVAIPIITAAWAGLAVMRTVHRALAQTRFANG